MNLTFLGDALDHWKGSLFESLTREGIFRNFAVDPMASDLPAWQPDDFRLFAELLRVDRSQIVEHQSTLSDRSTYFAEINHLGDLFLDPDTGVATGKRRPSQQHITASEIAGLLVPDRVLVVYQHVRARRVCDRVDAVCQVIRSQMSPCHWCSYESGTVALIFLARTAERISTVARHFSSLLGRHAVGRIRASTHEPEVEHSAGR
jgi:hypothetical protein